MSEDVAGNQLFRRWFLSRLGAGLAAGGAAIGIGGEPVRVEAAEGGRWEPTRHASDDWLDQIPGKHRLVFDTTTPAGFGNALAFAKNFYGANKTGYGLEQGDLAVVIVARHQATMFSYNDTVWAKYGEPISKRAQFTDPKTKEAPKTNLFNSDAYEALLPNRGTTLDSVLKLGVHLGVCQQSTRGNSASIAAASGGKAEAIYDDLVANLISRNAHLVPAGIVAVGRAQERGYSFVASF